MSAAASPEPAISKHEKKRKKDKSSKSEKKRAREEDAAADGERKHKKSKSISANVIASNGDLASSQNTKKEKKNRDKDKKSKYEGDAADEVDAATALTSEKKKRKKHKQEQELTQVGDMADLASKSDKKEKKKEKKKGKEEEKEEEEEKEKEKKKKKKKKEKQKKHAEVADDDVEAKETPAQPAAHDLDAMDVDEPSDATCSGIYQPPDISANPQFPFFKQTVSLYEPIYPNGWAQPVTSAQYQHLQHLLNKYVPSLRGVLLDYKNVSLGPEPSRDGAAADDESPTTLLSKGEYAVGFGWITADVELFVPSRGAWMEGSVNLQTEGHIGVVCFGKFNASIEASRLPPPWRWVSNESAEATGFEETASVMTADDHGVVRQIHSTGFWVDGSGTRIKGKIRFRIRNFDAGTSGETSYLSLEGTMLDKSSEKKLIQEEARLAQVRREKKGGRRMQRRRAPEFSMTRFAPEESENQQENQGGAAPAEESNTIKFDG